ncbi:MAG: hypothetical protein ABUL46_03215, partial [Chitinophaga rupis]
GMPRTCKPPEKCLLCGPSQAYSFATKIGMAKDEQLRDKMFENIRAWQQGDVSQKEWCRQRDIPYHIFHYWYRKFKDQQEPAGESGSFIQLAMTPTPAAECEVVFADGTRIVFHQSVPAQYLRSLLF